jgi:hypothetical protein
MLMNLRTPADEYMPASNSVSMVFLDRQGRDLADAARLLKSIHRQIQRIKRFQLQYTYLWSLRVARHAPASIARILLEMYVRQIRQTIQAGSGFGANILAHYEALNSRE